jgi:hypothetical protein
MSSGTSSQTVPLGFAVAFSMRDNCGAGTDCAPLKDGLRGLLLVAGRF